MTMNKEQMLAAVAAAGLKDATTLQHNASSMTGTELNAASDRIPAFAAAVAKTNMLNRTAGFVCISSAGRVVKLLQPYDSTVYTQEPEELPAQWGFQWSTDPKKALPFIALSTSPYGKDDCCTHNGHVWRSGQSNNVWAPGTVGVSWTDLGTIEEVMA